MTVLRSLLFVPGNKESMLAKAAGLAPDVIVPDMEDSVPDAEKANARKVVREFLPQLGPGRRPRQAAGAPLVLPRVNSLHSGLIEADLEAVVGPDIYGISVGKVDDAVDLSRISNLIAKLELRAGLAVGSLRLIPWIETARGIVNCHAICMASERIVGVAFGGEDFTNDMAIERLDDDAQLVYARSAVCTAARAAGVAALDTPYFQFRDSVGLRASSIAAKRLGFKGRFAIHPDQIPVINECFVPSAIEIAEAERIVAAFAEAEARGRGSTSLDGRVIDVPVVKRAHAVLEAAGRAS
jgi:citrate lyase subunit beta / citryl-CoA lyase